MPNGGSCKVETSGGWDDTPFTCNPHTVYIQFARHVHNGAEGIRVVISHALHPLLFVQCAVAGRGVCGVGEVGVAGEGEGEDKSGGDAGCSGAQVMNTTLIIYSDTLHQGIRKNTCTQVWYGIRKCKYTH